MSQNQSSVAVTTRNTISLTLGIISLVLGVCSLLVGWIPFLGMIAIPAAVIGVCLGALGLLIAAFKRFQGFGMPLIGCVVSGAAAVLPITMTASFGAAMAKTAAKSEQVERAETATASTPAPAAVPAPDATPAPNGESKSAKSARTGATAADEKADYIRDHVLLYEPSVGFKDAILDGRVPGVTFKLKNTGSRELQSVKVVAYFKDANGQVISEEAFYPVSKYGLHGSNPLKPGYVWQIEKGKFFAAKSVPSEWQEGAVDLVVKEIEFAK